MLQSWVVFQLALALLPKVRAAAVELVGMERGGQGVASRSFGGLLSFVMGASPGHERRLLR